MTSAEFDAVGPRTAITTYILKVASRCNLACTYCYMYTGVDQSWRQMPGFMDPAVARAAIDDIASYAMDCELDSVSLVFHGGEPFLYPKTSFAALLGVIHDSLVARGIGANLSIQTNATVLPQDTLNLLLSAGVGFGVSLDLSDASHDAMRIDKQGRGTSSRVKEGIDFIRKASGNSQPEGALFVIDPAVSPREAFDRLAEIGVAFVDILLPDQNWESSSSRALAKSYGQWLLDFFAIYTRSPRVFAVRWIQTAFKLALGGLWGSDSMGENSAGTLIVETNGEYVFHDVLRTASEELNRTGFSAGSRSIGEIERLPLMQTMTKKVPYLSDECITCDVRALCGGGHIAHRYSAADGFRNTSVYCGALKPFYREISAFVETCGRQG